MEGGRPRPRLTPWSGLSGGGLRFRCYHHLCARKFFLAVAGSSKYNGTYMGQITIYLDVDTERLVKRHAKASGESASKWIAEAVRKRASDEWPADILSLFGTWKDEDFPDVSSLRAGYGIDLPREEF